MAEESPKTRQGATSTAAANRLKVTGASSLAHLDHLVAERVFPGAALALASRDESECVVVTTGRLMYDHHSAAVTPRTMYDLASVTKVIGALGVAITLVARGELSLSTLVRDVIPDWGGGRKDDVTVGHLLSHTSGLASHAPFFLTCSNSETMQQAVKSSPLLTPPGKRCVYSDLGIILLGEVLEVTTGIQIGTLIAERVLKPLALEETMFNPPKERRPWIAPTEDDPWRDVIVHGVVHDENAYAMGGVAPHAGLFSTAADVARFGRALLAGTAPRLADSAVVRRFTTRAPELPGPWTYGVRLFGGDPLFGRMLSREAFGATGFTGTLLAIDPVRGLSVALLSNRVHPTRELRGFNDARGPILDIVLHAYDSAASTVDSGRWRRRSDERDAP